jgi:hypothetical protein
MYTRRLGRLAVFDGEDLEGIISQSLVVKFISENIDELYPHPDRTIEELHLGYR